MAPTRISVTSAARGTDVSESFAPVATSKRVRMRTELARLQETSPAALTRLYANYAERLAAAGAAAPEHWDGVYDPERK